MCLCVCVCVIVCDCVCVCVCVFVCVCVCVCSYDAMLDLKGNTAVYLQYAHARIAGIVRKVGVCASTRKHVKCMTCVPVDMGEHSTHGPWSYRYACRAHCLKSKDGEHIQKMVSTSKTASLPSLALRRARRFTCAFVCVHMCVRVYTVW